MRGALNGCDRGASGRSAQLPHCGLRYTGHAAAAEPSAVHLKACLPLRI